MNNVAKNNSCPPLMSDGRLFTDYQSSKTKHHQILMNAKKHGFNNVHELRQFFTQYGKDIQQYNNYNNAQKNMCIVCDHQYQLQQFR
jgi:hypothetical protein